jgi:ribonuclease-3
LIRLLSQFSSLSKQDKDFKRKLKNIIGVSPVNLALYKQAFRHRSSKKQISEFSPSNERLEFLGDAVLGTIVAEYLFKLFPKKDEGFLTQMRSRIVNGQNLFLLSKKFGFDVLLNSKLTKDEQLSSSAYGDVFEAFIGALYLDKGFDAAKKFVVENVIKLHLDMNEIVSKDTDYKSQLQIMMQKQKKTFEYKLIHEALAGKHKIYTIQLLIEGHVEAEFEDKSKKAAEQKAAQLVLEKINT